MATWSSLPFELKSCILSFSILNALTPAKIDKFVFNRGSLGIIEQFFDKSLKARNNLIAAFPSMATETRRLWTTFTASRPDLAAQWTMEFEDLLNRRPGGICTLVLGTVTRRMWAARAQRLQCLEWIVLDVVARAARPGWTKDEDGVYTSSLGYIKLTFCSDETYDVLIWTAEGYEEAGKIRLADVWELTRRIELMRQKLKDDEDESEDEVRVRSTDDDSAGKARGTNEEEEKDEDEDVEELMSLFERLRRKESNENEDEDEDQMTDYGYEGEDDEDGEITDDEDPPIRFWRDGTGDVDDEAEDEGDDDEEIVFRGRLGREEGTGMKDDERPAR